MESKDAFAMGFPNKQHNTIVKLRKAIVSALQETELDICKVI